MEPKREIGYLLHSGIMCVIGEGDEVFVDCADEEHGDDFHGRRGTGRLCRQQPLVDLGAIAVDEDEADADAGEEDEVGDDGGRGFHGGGTGFDDDGLATKLLDEGRRRIQPPFVQYDNVLPQLGQMLRTQASLSYRTPIGNPFCATGLNQTSQDAVYM
ncbi:unnamed protein product [Camellia sinensis]